MIAVLSYDWYEQGTDPVIDWLIYYKADFIKITIQDFIKKRDKYLIDINNNEIILNGESVKDKINVVWYRRFEHDLLLNFSKSDYTTQILRELNNEIIELTDYLFFMFNDKIWLPNYKIADINKLKIIKLAEQYGINTPKTIVTNNKNILLEFYKICDGKIIMKPIKFSGYYFKGDKTYSSYTTKISAGFINEIPNYFAPTLFQEKILSEFEIRTFYLDGNFFSSAIILINSSEVIDIKQHFNSENITWVPYRFPDEYLAKLDTFFKSINLNTCSFDVVLSNDGEYILLDVNPVGQYSAPGNKCNFILEREIAKWLIKNDKKKENNIQ